MMRCLNPYNLLTQFRDFFSFFLLECYRAVLAQIEMQNSFNPHCGTESWAGTSFSVTDIQEVPKRQIILILQQSVLLRRGCY